MHLNNTKKKFEWNYTKQKKKKIASKWKTKNQINERCVFVLFGFHLILFWFYILCSLLLFKQKFTSFIIRNVLHPVLGHICIAVENLAPANAIHIETEHWLNTTRSYFHNINLDCHTDRHGIFRGHEASK